MKVNLTKLLEILPRVIILTPNYETGAQTDLTDDRTSPEIVYSFELDEEQK